MSDRVWLRVPARSKSLRLARLTAAAYAAVLLFPEEAIEDVRVATDELCSAIIEGVSIDETLELELTSEGDMLRVLGRVGAPVGTACALHPVARDLLDLVAGSYGIEERDGSRSFWLSKSGAVRQR